MTDQQKSASVHVSDRSVRNIGVVQGSIVTGDHSSVGPKPEVNPTPLAQKVALSAAHWVPALIGALAALAAAIIIYFKR